MGKRLLMAGALMLLTAAAHAQVYRCGNAYSHTPCAGGTSVDTRPPVSDPSGPRTTLVYLCRAPQSTLYWIAEPCATRGWTLERTARVASDLPWQEQLEAARGQRRDAEQLAAPPPAGNSAPPSPPRANPQAVCAALDERVQSLDSMGRAGSQYYNLEWVRSERKSARDQQFRLRCR